VPAPDNAKNITVWIKSQNEHDISHLLKILFHLSADKQVLTIFIDSWQSGTA